MVYFIVLISSLIFVHELGHFMFAKAFGVKVLTFSLGFGPKVLRVRGGETEYCVGLLPLGGYVRMLEESRNDDVLPEDRFRTFESQAWYKRVIIVLAGPAVNLLFPVLLFFCVFVTEGPFPPPTVGLVLPGQAADGQLQPGDRIMAVDDRPIGTFDELKEVVRRSPGQTLRFTVFRETAHTDVEVTVEPDVVAGPLETEETVGVIGIGKNAPAPVIGVPSPDSPAHRAGLRTFDVVTHVAGRPVRRFMDLERALMRTGGATIPITYLRPRQVDGALGGLARLAVYEAGMVSFTPDLKGATLVERTGIELPELYAAHVPRTSALWEAGLRSGDKVLRLDGERQSTWRELQDAIAARPMAPHRIDFLRASDGTETTGTFQVRRFDVRNWVPVAPEKPVPHPAPVRRAFFKAVGETWKVTGVTLVALGRLVQGRLSLDSLAGPITIYQLAGQEGRKGPRYFLWLMAFLSINLGLWNLLPIPVLDGGHLVFFGLEVVLRRPVPVRVREVAHVAGVVLLVLVMAFVFKNDFEKTGTLSAPIFQAW